MAAIGIALALLQRNTLDTARSVLRLTLLVSAIASASFAATLAFAPAVIDTGARLVFGSAQVAAPAPAATKQLRECAPLAKIVAALQRRDC